MKKALILADAASTIHLFNETDIDILQSAGFEVHAACNFVCGNTASPEAVEKYKKDWEERGIILHQIGFSDSPFSMKFFKLYRETKKLIRKNNFDIIYCHTQTVGVLTRLAARPMRKKGTKVIYTARGFRFFDGCGKVNWLKFYVTEKLLAAVTDALITINKEDYESAVKEFHAKRIYYVHGTGVDADKIKNTRIDIKEKRRALGIGEDDVLLISVGELNARKNHETAIKALARCGSKDRIQYIIAGAGDLKDYLNDLSEKLGVSKRVHLLGFREDIYELLKISDIFVFPSYSEDLPASLAEAMAAGLPAIASAVRGNVDLIDDNLGGFLCNPYDDKEIAELIDILAEKKAVRRGMGAYNIEKVKICDKEKIMHSLAFILGELCAEGEKGGGEL